MNAAELNQVERALSSPFCHAIITHQGRTVTFSVVGTGPLRYGIQVYVDRIFKGAWTSAKTPCPEQLYMRRMDRPLHKPADLKGMKRVLGAKKFAEAQARRWVYFSGQWPSARTLCRHLAKHCPDAVLVYPEPATPGAAAAPTAAPAAAPTGAPL